ncbi:hypothetical protein B0T17DRAFT_174270 [Bombardia bombarda]|uniref:Uncharacterized protein n=1 Tax=Bombardia bombarda TaxID=252184 RepID=A0AA39X808_9PEZI|nr:hypothetical protein B0T17DRAFT_174270 [Bombardia bombarda]
MRPAPRRTLIPSSRRPPAAVVPFARSPPQPPRCPIASQLGYNNSYLLSINPPTTILHQVVGACPPTLPLQ